MKKLFLTLIAFATVATASADIRIFNGTSDDIVVDVLSQHGQQRDVLIPARTLSPIIGAKRVPANTTEIVVYKDKNGNEIARDEYWSGSGFFFGYHSENSFRKDAVYSFKASDNRNDLAQIINNTGSKLETKYETPDFEIQESSIFGPDPYASGVHKKNLAASSFIHLGEANATREVTLNAPVFDGPQKANFKGGHVYLLEADDGKLKVTQVFP